MAVLPFQLLRNCGAPGLQKRLGPCFVLDLFRSSLAHVQHHSVHEATVFPRRKLLDPATFQPSQKVLPQFLAQNPFARLQLWSLSPFYIATGILPARTCIVVFLQIETLRDGPPAKRQELLCAGYVLQPPPGKDCGGISVVNTLTTA